MTFFTGCTVVIVGDGAEWSWNRATWFIRRCEILDFWHAMEHAWAFAGLHYGEGSKQADQGVRQIGVDLKAGKIDAVIARLKRMRPKSPQLRASLDSLIRYYSENAGRMRYDEYIRRDTGSGAERWRAHISKSSMRACAPSRDALERGRRAPSAGGSPALVERQLGDAGPFDNGLHRLLSPRLDLTSVVRDARFYLETPWAGGSSQGPALCARVWRRPGSIY